MEYTVENLKSDIIRKIRCDESSNFLGAINEAARKMLTRIDPSETKRTTYIETAVFFRESRYMCPPDLKSKKVYDIRKQDTRGYWQDFGQLSNRQFDKYYSTNPWLALNSFTIENESGKKWIRFSDCMTPRNTVLNNCDSLSNNGTWNVYGNVANLTIDKLQKYEAYTNWQQTPNNSTSSLRFDLLDTGTTGALENINIKNVDLTDFYNVGAIFADLFTDKIQHIQTIKFTWGSSPTDYYSFTITAPHNWTDFYKGWNPLKFSFDTPVVVGNPDIKNITRIRFDFTTDGTPIYGVHLDNVTARAGQIYEIKYYSSALFSDPETKEWKEQATDLSDVINLSYVSYNILMLEACRIIAQETENSINDLKIFEQQLEDEYSAYLTDNKSEYEKPVSKYYRNQFGNGGYGYGNGAFWGYPGFGGWY